MTKHTPGPWEIDWYICREGNKELWRVPRSIGPVYVDHNHWAGNYITVDEADARLIAAAPTMYDALRQSLAFCEGVRGSDRIVQVIRAAIAEAEGT